MRNTTPNARLWAVANRDIVKLTVKPGQTLNWHRAYQDDEGYSMRWARWSHEGDFVQYEDGFDGRDCDGRISRYDAFTAGIDRLHAGPVDQETGVSLPAWIRTESGQRDYAAEAAGY